MAKTHTRKSANGVDEVNINKVEMSAHKSQRRPRRRTRLASSVVAAEPAATVAGAATVTSQAAADNAALSITSNEALTQSAVPSEPGSHSRSSDLLRASTKRAKLVGMLERTQGASVTEIGQRLGWLPHTVRAAITGLRHTGRDVTRGKDENGQTVYRLAPVETPGR
jgi:Protein of unknown function (DUF3489)